MAYGETIREGLAWLAEQPLPTDESLAIERHLRELDRLGEDLAAIETVLARQALEDENVRRLTTIIGVNMALPPTTCATFGLNPSVRQSRR